MRKYSFDILRLGFRCRLALTPFSVLQLDELLRYYCGQHDTTGPGTIGVTVRCCFTSFVLGIASYSCCCDLLVEIVCVRLVFLILLELSYYRGRAIVSRPVCWAAGLVRRGLNTPSRVHYLFCGLSAELRA